MANICCDDVIFYTEGNPEGLYDLWEDLETYIILNQNPDLCWIGNLFSHKKIDSTGISLRGNVSYIFNNSMSSSTIKILYATFITSFYQYTTKKTINKQQEKHFEPPIAGRLLLCPKAITNTTYRFYVVRCFRIFFYFLSQVLNQTVNSVIHF